MQRGVALTLLCVLLISTLAGCVATQQPASHGKNVTATPTPSAGVAIRSSNAAAQPAHYLVSVGTATVDAEAADTPEKEEIGLMGRASLDPDAGMLFLFSYPDQQSMWMKNMQFPLDIIFITEDLHVERVYTDVPPCADDPCPSYVSDGPVLYALEVNAGFCASHDIVTGAPVTITPS